MSAQQQPMTRQHFRSELEGLINRYSIESGSNTPDYILADYLMDCLRAFDSAVNVRTEWYRDTPDGADRTAIIAQDNPAP
jgi:hypothetical protein